MNFDDAIRLTEILLGFAFAQQSIEHFSSFANERLLFIPRWILAGLLIIGFHTSWVLLLLLIISLAMLYRFQGPYNGGSDRMSLLILCCLCLVHFAPTPRWQEIAFGYLALQLILFQVGSKLKTRNGEVAAPYEMYFNFLHILSVSN